MLSERELEQTAAQLTGFSSSRSQHQETLSVVLKDYATLIENYKRLRSDYEEERDSRERYKQMARGQERNPFVLVLIDGDGYIFEDDLVSNGAEGGQKAAQLLNDVVKRSMQDQGLDHCRIMVRVYANLVGLSKALARSNLAGKEKRSLAPFAANFTRSNDLFDYVDAGELKENADFKIRAMFRQFAENAQCRHIYFAGCHDVGYINDLTPYASNRDRITLVKTPAFHPEFSKLGMRIEEFPGIFRTTPLNGEPIVHKAAPPPTPLRAAHTPQPTNMSSSDDSAQVCSFFQRGTCKYGKDCRFVHIKQNANGHTKTAASNNNSIRKSREDLPDNKAFHPFHMSKTARSDNDFMSGHAAKIDRNGGNAPMEEHIASGNTLPQGSDIPNGLIPINKDGHRLDPYIPHVSSADYEAFNARTARQKLCNNYHIAGFCPQGEACTYDHQPAKQGVVNALKEVVYGNPCPRKGNCRRTACLYGHVCQKAECGYRGGKAHCKFSSRVHGMELSVAEYVEGEGYPGAPKRVPGVLNGDTTSTEESTSEWDSQRPTQPSSEWQTESDGEGNMAEGALLDFGDDAPPN